MNYLIKKERWNKQRAFKGQKESPAEETTASDKKQQHKAVSDIS